MSCMSWLCVGLWNLVFSNTHKLILLIFVLFWSKVSFILILKYCVKRYTFVFNFYFVSSSALTLNDTVHSMSPNVWKSREHNRGLIENALWFLGLLLQLKASWREGIHSFKLWLSPNRQHYGFRLWQTGLLFGGLCGICCYAGGVVGHRAIPVPEEDLRSL